MKLSEFLSTYKHYKMYDKIKEICEDVVSGDDINTKMFISLSNKVSSYEDNAVISYKGDIIYERPNTFNMSLTDDIKGSWDAFRTRLIENHMKSDHFYNYFYDVDTVIESDDFDSTEFKIEIKRTTNE